jgi:oxygen-dependent protoporphyrinogen oxidase
MRCIVAGAGISGLAVAHALAQRGVEVVVLEAAARAGGKIESVREDGWLCESGPQGFLDREPLVTALAEELGLVGQLVDALPAARRRAVVADGRIADVPMGPLPFLRSRLLSVAGKLRLAGDLVLPRAQDGDESVASFARRRLGHEAAERLFFPLVSGLYAGDPERISVASAFPFLVAFERADRSLLVGAARAIARSRAGGVKLRTFADGMETLTRALASRLGPRLRVGAAARRLVRDGRAWRVAVEERGETVEIAADVVVLAMPSYAARPLVVPLDAAAGEALGAIGFVPVTLCYAGYRTHDLPRPLDRYGFLVARGEPLTMLGAVFSSAAFPGRAPEGGALISVRLGGARHPEVSALDDDDLARSVHQELRPLVEARGEPIFFKPIRHAHALPQYTLGHAARVAALDRAEAALPGLYFTGNSYRGLGVSDCVREAARVAARITSARGVFAAA